MSTPFCNHVILWLIFSKEFFFYLTLRRIIRNDIVGVFYVEIKYSIHANPASIPVIKWDWYPDIAIMEKNKSYAEMLTEDLAAPKSEMTTVHQYLFQAWNIEEPYCTIQNVMERVSQVEIHHFNIIGQLITLLGGKASCRVIEKDGPVIWNGSMVNYTTKIKEMMENNMEAERGAADTYWEQSKKVKDPYLSKMLERLAWDEQLHFELFRNFLVQL